MGLEVEIESKKENKKQRRMKSIIMMEHTLITPTGISLNGNGTQSA